MKTNELRIGNLIKYDPTGTIIKVDYHHIRLFSISDPPHVAIEFTEKIILDCGFVKLHHLGRYEFVLLIDEQTYIEAYFNEDGFNFVLTLINDNDDINIDVSSFTCYRSLNIKYIHQLQNIYFSLKGEELKHVLI